MGLSVTPGWRQSGPTTGFPASQTPSECEAVARTGRPEIPSV